MEVEGQVGPQFLSDGTVETFRQGRSGEQVVTELHGRYYEQTYRKNVFTAFAASVATSVAGTGLIGIQIWNGSPIANGVNLALLKIGGQIAVTSAGVLNLQLATGTGQVVAPTSTTTITSVTNNFIGGQGSQATATNAGTFTNAPTARLSLLHNTVAIAVTGEDAGFMLDLEGSIIIPPQCYVCIVANNNAAAAASCYLYIMWEEVAA